MDLTSLKRLAEAATPGPWEAAHAGQGSFGGKFVITEHFVRRPGDDIAIVADVIEPGSGAPSAENASYIAALSPDKLLKLIAVVEAARASTDVFEEATGYVGCSAFSPSMESECKTALAALRSALKELDK